ncbi:hypothetical protein [Actinotalea sp. K2]|uniref:hypothetical protein n=1 Tax=Actinotalea sp. K2 TaxID=2939438 RepID=UPI0020178131|nr:hypothetical protein [Actinotalea sp. K2]MCL3860960.1 hypothetical protein [Actinotalea sp. K2]
MAQTMLAPKGASGPVPAAVVLHGSHPLRGYPVTWHITPVTDRAGTRGMYRVERADGEIHDPLVWRLAEKDVDVMARAEVQALVRHARR